MKKLLFSLISLIAFAFLVVRPSYALDEKLKITLTDLPDNRNTTEFRVYYTYFDTFSKTANVNLFVEKDGQGFRQTQERDKTAVSGYFEVKSSDIYDGQGKYNFYASAVTDGLSVNSGTISTTIDQNAPGNVLDYHKERVSANDYKLYWKCPSDEDVAQTYIYRSKDTSFTADPGTRVQEISCNKDETKSTVVVGENADYYFALRAIDRAGNASGVVTDAPGSVVAGQVAGASTGDGSGEGTVKILPKEMGQGGEEEATEEGQIGGGTSSEAGEVKGDMTSNLLNNKYFQAGAGIVGLALIGLVFLKRKK